ncbi:hypothetical protein GCM10027605_62980 [Micromonospora zhanjiangensis]
MAGRRRDLPTLGAAGAGDAAVPVHCPDEDTRNARSADPLPVGVPMLTTDGCADGRAVGHSGPRNNRCSRDSRSARSGLRVSVGTGSTPSLDGFRLV